MNSSSSITQSVLAVSLPAARSGQEKEPLPKTVRVALARINEQEASRDVKQLFAAAKEFSRSVDETMKEQSCKIAEFMRTQCKEKSADPEKAFEANLEALETFFYHNRTVADLASMEIKPEIAFEQCAAIKGALDKTLSDTKGTLFVPCDRPHTKEFIPLLAIACREYPRAFHVTIAGASLTKDDLLCLSKELRLATGVVDLSKCTYTGSPHAIQKLKKIATEDLLIILPKGSSR